MIQFKVGSDNIRVEGKNIYFNDQLKSDWSLSYVGGDIVGVHDNKKNLLYSTFNDKTPIKTTDKEQIKI